MRRQRGGVRRTGAVRVALVVALVAGCGGGNRSSAEDGPRPLTLEEATALAQVRFRLEQASPVPVVMTWPTAPATRFAVALDLAGGIASGSFETFDGRTRLERGFVGWNLRMLTTAQSRSRRAVPRSDRWYARRMSTGVPRDVFLALALNLGSDRPENPAVLRQSSARFLRNDAIDGRPMHVFEGPRPAGRTDEGGRGRLRYWLDERLRFRRLEAYLGDPEGRFAQISLSPEHPLQAAARRTAGRVLSNVSRGTR